MSATPMPLWAMRWASFMPRNIFRPRQGRKAQEMVKNIVAAWGYAGWMRLTWMTPATRKQARQKLEGLYVGIGYPEKWRDYSALEVKKGDAFGNRALTSISLIITAPQTSASRWSGAGSPADPQTVNAVNLPLQEGVEFPRRDSAAPLLLRYRRL